MQRSLVVVHLRIQYPAGSITMLLVMLHSLPNVIFRCNGMLSRAARLIDLRGVVRRVANLAAHSVKHSGKCGRFRLAFFRLLAICGSFAGVTGLSADGPGGPLLVVTHATNGFSQYYSEILLAEV